MKKFDAATFLEGVAKLKESGPTTRPLVDVLVEFLKDASVRKEVGEALKAGYSRSAIAMVLRKQHAVSLPTIRRALDEVFPRKAAEQASPSSTVRRGQAGGTKAVTPVATQHQGMQRVEV